MSVAKNIRALASPEKATPPAASDLERARAILHYPRGYLTHHESELLMQLASEFAAIRAEAKAEGWEDAVKALREWIDDLVAEFGDASFMQHLREGADWLAANRPTGRED